MVQKISLFVIDCRMGLADEDSMRPGPCLSFAWKICLHRDQKPLRHSICLQQDQKLAKNPKNCWHMCLNSASNQKRYKLLKGPSHSYRIVWNSATFQIFSDAQGTTRRSCYWRRIFLLLSQRAAAKVRKTISINAGQVTAKERSYCCRNSSNQCQLRSLVSGSYS